MQTTIRVHVKSIKITTSSGRDRHRTSSAEDLQLNRSALDASDAQCNSAIVDLVVTVLLEQSVGDLGQAKSFLGLDDQGDDGNAIEDDRADLSRSWCQFLVLGCGAAIIVLIVSIVNAKTMIILLFPTENKKSCRKTLVAIHLNDKLMPLEYAS